MTVGGSGLVYIFDREGTNFNQVGILSALPSNTESNDQFGWSLAISGDGKTVAVGARYDEDPGSGSESGIVYVFDRVGNDFNRAGILTGSLAGDANDNFGSSVALNGDGNTLVIGAKDDELVGGNTEGLTYVFDRINGSYSEVGILTHYSVSTSPDPSDALGSSAKVSYDGNIIAVGAAQDETTGIVGTGVVHL